MERIEKTYVRCKLIELGQVAIVDVITEPFSNTLEFCQISLVDMIEVVPGELNRNMVAGLPLDK